MAGGNDPIDLSTPLPEKTEDKKEDDVGPMTSPSQVFGKFGRTGKVKTLRILGYFFAFLSGCVYPIMAFYFARSFEDLGGQVGADSGDAYMDQVRGLVWVFLYLGAGAFITISLQAICLEIAASDAQTDFKVQWFDALLRQDMAYYDIKDVSAQATIVAANANKFKRGIGRKLAEGIQFFITVIGGFVYAFWESWEVSLIILAVVPLMAGSAAFMLTVGTKQTERKNKNYAETGGIVYNTISEIRTVFSLNACEKMIEDFKKATKKAQDSAIGFTFWVGLANGGLMGSFLVSYIALTLYGAWKLYSQVRSDGCDPSNIMKGITDTCDITGRQVFGALMGVSFGAMGLAQIGGAAEALNASRSAAYPALLAIERTVERDAGMDESGFKDEADDVEAKGEPSTPLEKEEIPLPKYIIDSSSDEGKKPNSVDGEIIFSNVSFRYPTRQEALVFDGLSLTIKPGQTVALVGPSGSGKSTTVSLLERFYDPTGGSIMLDGTDLKELNVSWLREQIGLVSQEPVLFARSIKENIAYGLPGATDEQIIAVAKAANAHDFVSKFPQGYDTDVGDKGAQLSGGQKQRIAIARILLKNPKILLLDEATSALDSESEYIVQQALDEVVGSGNRTTIIIAHRLSTIRNADVIAVVKDGRIAEQGSHSELIAKNGEYAKLVEAQAPKQASATTSTSGLSSSFTNLLASGNYSNAEKVDSPQVEFKGVHFHYPSRPENSIFKGLDLSVKHGETLAIVGPSGGGKSTVIQMIERFYDPVEGSVEYEGSNLKDLNVKWLRDQIGLVSQEPKLFNTTIGENIKYGLQSATQQDIEEAAMKANAHDFIMSFPNGYNTQVGENATQVSGGQKQRIAIARAILKKPKILLFDEATSALDSQSEAVVQKAIDNLMETKNQTVVVIAHRLSTIRNADRIAVVADGVIAEIGPHDYLMAKPDGHYRRLVEYNELGGEKKKTSTKKDDEEEDSGNVTDTDSAVVDGELEKEKVKEISNRARVMARSDTGLFFIGGIGAILAGLLYPGWGVVFAYMIELLYHPMFPCDDSLGSYTSPRNEVVFETCQDYFDYEADYLRDFSINVTYAWIGIIASGLIGNVLLFYGFGAATERMNKRVRDQIFVALMRQDVSYYDTHSLSNLSTRLEDDAAMMHSFSGEPIRQLMMTVASVVVGLVLSFYFMWPFALLTLAILPFMSFGAYMEMKMYIGEDAAADDIMEGEDSSGSIVVETLTSIRTVASLSIERMRANEYVRAINLESPSSLKSNAMKGFASGLGIFIQFWGMGLMFWWGAWLLNRYDYSFRDFLISLNSLLFSLSGLSVAIVGATDSAKAKLAANRIFALVDRKSPIDALSDEGKKTV